MLGLTLREEFQGVHAPGTMIQLRDGAGNGAAERSPDYILSITYPTADVQTALKNVGAARAKRPIVLMGDRGRGKSHILAVVHHAIASPKAVEKWARAWGDSLGAPLRDLSLVAGFHPITEAVHHQEYKFLWDLLFDRHPKGQYFRGKFEQLGQPFPPRSLLISMFEKQPTALILDEFQKWFDGLSDEPGTDGIKYRTLAENFIQNLSELSKDRPDIFMLIVSVLNNSTEAFRQIHRDTPVVVNFQGPTARKDRQNLLLHRLFENRANVADAKIRKALATYAGERFRLNFPNLSEADRAIRAQEVIDTFPFSPELLELLDNQILMAASAQETRDLIRILAFVYQARGEEVPLITPADFLIDEDGCGVQSLLDSIATVGDQEVLREIAQRNLETVRTAVGPDVPHARELVSALWMRSMTPGRNPGGTRQELHLDITRGEAIDDNAFQAELMRLVENSINIHGEQTVDGRLHFDIQENPRSKVRATARNARLWQSNPETAPPGHTAYPGQDIEHLRKTIRAILSADTSQNLSRVVVLGPNWRTSPWSDVEENDQPAKWNMPVLIVFPETPVVAAGGALPEIGEWLAKHVPKRRNTLRYLFPAAAVPALFVDGDLLFAARCSFLTGVAWKDDPKYRPLKEEFDRPFRDTLKKRFDRFSILRSWDFQKPRQCVFELEKVPKQGYELPNGIEEKIVRELFDQARFGRLLLERAKEHHLVNDLLDELVEPPSAEGTECIPYLGDIPTFERMMDAAAEGRIALNVDGTWVSRLPDHENDDQARRYVRAKAFKTVQEMGKIQIGLPEEVGGAVVPGPKPVSPLPPPPVTPKPVTPPSGGGTCVYPVGPSPALTAAVVNNEHSETPATGINLMANFEKWGLDAGTTLKTARLEFSGLTVQQMKQVLQRLPSSVKASLDITYSGEED